MKTLINGIEHFSIIDEEHKPINTKVYLDRCGKLYEEDQMGTLIPLKHPYQVLVDMNNCADYAGMKNRQQLEDARYSFEKAVTELKNNGIYDDRTKKYENYISAIDFVLSGTVMEEEMDPWKDYRYFDPYS